MAKIPLDVIVRSFVTVSENGAVSLNVRTAATPLSAEASFLPARLPSVPTATLSADAVASITTVDPLVIVTLSPAVGTNPPTQVEGALHGPPAAVEAMAPCGFVVAESGRSVLKRRP